VNAKPWRRGVITAIGISERAAGWPASEQIDDGQQKESSVVRAIVNAARRATDLSAILSDGRGLARLGSGRGDFGEVNSHCCWSLGS